MSIDCIFCKIVAGEIPCTKIYESDSVIAFKDLHPASPVHLLIVPKMHYKDLNDFQLNDKDLLGDLLLAVPTIAKQEGIESYRTVINTGVDAGQTVFHLHLHLLAGRKHNWPPG